MFIVENESTISMTKALHMTNNAALEKAASSYNTVVYENDGPKRLMGSFPCFLSFFFFGREIALIT